MNEYIKEGKHGRDKYTEKFIYRRIYTQKDLHMQEIYI